MPDSPSISRPGSTLPLSDASTPSSPATGGRQPADGAAHASQQAGANLSQLAANGSNEATGKRRGASFSANTSSAARPLVAQQGAGGAPGPSRPGRFGGLAQGVGTVANDATGLASAGLNVLGGVMQLEQAAVNQIAELIKQGARNIEEASKG
ncbi:hypothetical protein DSC91_002331 [Paraburkholderia caffeinilytica]|uniref:Uncharacterized protein n=1 Tax=Paraburkholderia caffeinilytica TaxID=1761016 RepID=A0ABQ1MN81_9BURK|nr:hypothetical protein [Paraburkholderia caffeinilytica]AXL50225.1 hypothetical protein DSC91_002331 [Paraburkholderia caffeinilytica]GGC41803.1 hypothetical protein GCM10011400_30830 [Paraburkholderia caffeinilytica]CAB3797120.1 hypothetical protein LMG28690_04471 [Paraburkholderia caffeinilytica]